MTQNPSAPSSSPPPTPAATPATIRPAAGPLRGAVSVPGDKSIAHRALMLGALTTHGLPITNLPTGHDVRSTRHCLTSLGVPIRDEIVTVSAAYPSATTRTVRLVHVGGRGMDAPFCAPSGPLDCGNSGTTMRLLAGILAGQNDLCVELIGDESLSRRPMDRVATPLREMGAQIEVGPNGRPPIRIRGRRPLKALDFTLPMPSAQVKSCVLLAGLFADGTTRVTDPFDTRDHTERLLTHLSAGQIPRIDGHTIALQPTTLAGGTELAIPGDVSSAAFFAAAAALVPHSAIIITNVGLNPTRTGFIDVLREMGARIAVERSRYAASESTGDLHVEPAPLRAIHVAAPRVPSLIDEVPLLAVVASQAHGTTRIDGLAELRHKESDRLRATANNLHALGVVADIDGDSLLVTGPSLLRRPTAPIATHGDHRMAMAFAVAALVADAPLVLDDAGCIAISYPEFFATLDTLTHPQRDTPHSPPHKLKS